MKIPALKNNKILISIIAATMLTMNAYANDKTSLVIAAVAMQKDNQLQIVLRERVEHIASKLKSEGIESIDVYLSDNVPDMVEAIKKGEVDWVSDSLFMSLILSEETQSEIFIRKDKDVKKHETIFFVSKTSKSTSIKWT